ncbi:MAG: exodeoxyribonuclease VII large subunit [Alphaproteobacteria bacterium]
MNDTASNAYEFTVSELAFSLKRTIEEQFGHVRVRGELGRVTIAKSGHCYLDIKDDKAVINSIIWKGVMNRLSMRPEEGMEVICEGKLSTYPGRSNYQLVIEKMELAGAGALMALFEKRKQALAAEGLFDASRKVELPFMPKVIGVVTSPTGAVIRDILHRIADRFPAHVLVWPVLVQGDKAADQIAAAITGFNKGEGFPRPDVLIVARGGGSLEDLWCFNEENVVRAAANSAIPLISAVGHETDWTLIDYAADYRAPTPTGAAEVAVPVRADYLETLADYGLRLTRGLRRNVAEKTTRLSASRLPRLDAVIAPQQQRLDLAAARLPKADRMFDSARQKLALAISRLPSLGRLLDGPSQRLSALSSRLRPDELTRANARRQERLDGLSKSSLIAVRRKLERLDGGLTRSGTLLEAYSYQGVLARGYALVSGENGVVIRSKDSAKSGEGVTLTFHDGNRQAVMGGAAPKPKRVAKKKSPSASPQADLF